MKEKLEDLELLKIKLKETDDEVNKIYNTLVRKFEAIQECCVAAEKQSEKTAAVISKNWTDIIRYQINEELLEAANDTTKKSREIFEKNFTQILKGDTQNFKTEMIKELESFKNGALNKVIKTFFIGDYAKSGQIGGIAGRYMPNFIKDANATLNDPKKLEALQTDLLSKIKYDLFHFPASNKKAIGGSVSSNTPYLVGENGPELFVPDTYGSVVPNNRLGGNTKNINVTLNISANDYSGFQHNKQQIVGELTKTLKKHSRKF
ncbi:MAG: hypothetical protein J0G32_00850 [Alphaproteobacteria bacterium]|nr:hypothetical protein [Alphaproteobacteria bacterium]OJV14121.1 MAG: hypothetical protein BGO27_01375 [Alphaproteobacteria bacterium 33-17]